MISPTDVIKPKHFAGAYEFRKNVNAILDAQNEARRELASLVADELKYLQLITDENGMIYAGELDYLIQVLRPAREEHHTNHVEEISGSHKDAMTTQKGSTRPDSSTGLNARSGDSRPHNSRDTAREEVRK